MCSYIACVQVCTTVKSHTNWAESWDSAWFIFCFVPFISAKACIASVMRVKLFWENKMITKPQFQPWGLEMPVGFNTQADRNHGKNVEWMPEQPCSHKLPSKSTRLGEHWPRPLRKLGLWRDDTQHLHPGNTRKPPISRIREDKDNAPRAPHRI